MFLIRALISTDDHYLKPLCPPAPAQKAAKYAAMQALLGTGGYRGENHTLKQLLGCGGGGVEILSPNKDILVISHFKSQESIRRFPFCSTGGIMALLK